MAYKCLIAIIFLFQSYFAWSQNLVVDYEYTLDFNRTGSEKPFSARLYIENGKESWYYTLPVNSSSNTDSTKSILGQKDSILQVFKDYVNKKLVFNQRFFFEKNKNLNFQDSISLFEWTLVPESKKIGRFTCKKGLAIYKQRAYIAWYTEEIPINDGPWKLNGLPGLIIEAYTEDLSCHWMLTNLQKIENIEKSKRNISILLGDFEKMKSYFTASYNKFNEMQRAKDGVEINCADCGSNSEIKIKTLEYIFE